MRYLLLACDYDGTLAHHGRVDEATLAALDALLASGRKLVLVTGRELDELLELFPRAELFEWVVAENGALLYQPRSKQEKVLCERPPEEFVRQLYARGVGPISVGRAIVATWQPHENTVLQVIAELGLELQVIFNKGAVMVLPTGVNKATGLAAALKELGLSPHNVVGVGDAENDHAFLSLCECSVAVANALPALKERADFTTQSGHGDGVRELIEEMVAGDLRGREERLARHHLLLGEQVGGQEVRLPPYGISVLIAGPSGSGKSTAATGLIERLTEHGYQFCLIDPEGDFEAFEGAVVLGSGQQGPTADEVLQVLHSPGQNVVVNLTGLRIPDRPPFFLALLPRLLELRTRTGRPHWLVVDEAHHLVPASWEPGALVLPQALDRVLLITVHPDQVAPAVLSGVDTVIAVGAAPGDTLRLCCQAARVHPPRPLPEPAESGQVVLWRRHGGVAPFPVRLRPPHMERRRHVRKYAVGELPPDSSFYFRGPEGKLQLRAQNLHLFLQLADGIDDETWLFHLREGDYSRWFQEKIKDEVLAAEAAQVEAAPDVPPRESRDRMRQAVERHYTLPASTPLPVPGAG